MKKALALILALCLLLGLTACGTAQTAPTEAAETPVAETPVAETPATEEQVPEDRVYTYTESCGDFNIEWTVTLCGNGTFVLTEVHGLSGETTNHAGLNWVDNGDGTVSTGAWYNYDCDKSGFFAFDGSCTWILAENGTCEPDGSNVVAEGAVAPGKYSYDENRGDFVVTWTIYLNGNGSCNVEEYHGMSGETKTYETEGWTDNGDGTATTGAWLTVGDKSEFFAPNGVATWVINNDGTCEPIAEGGAQEAAGLQPGKYTFTDATPRGTTVIEVLLMGNGNCRIDVTEPETETVAHNVDGFTDLGNGYFETGALLDGEPGFPMDFFAPNGACVWHITDQAAAVIEVSNMEEAKGASASESADVAPGRYLYTGENASYAVLIMGNGECKLQLLAADGETVEAEYICRGWKSESATQFKTFSYQEGSEVPAFIEGDAQIINWVVTDAENGIVEIESMQS